MLFGILLTVQIIICLGLVGLVLVQRSEGGALGMGGSPSGFMSARGAGNFLSKATAVLAVLFFANSLGLTIVGNISQRGSSVVDQVGEGNISLDPATQTPAQTAPASGGAASSAAAPSLTQLPVPSAQVVAPPAATVSKPQASLETVPAAKPASPAPSGAGSSSSAATAAPAQ